MATVENFPPGADDVEPAREIASRLDSPHEVLLNMEFQFVQTLKGTIPETEFECFSHGWSHSVTNHFDGQSKRIFDGLAGDTLSNGLFFDEDSHRSYRKGEWGKFVDEQLAPTKKILGIFNLFQNNDEVFDEVCSLFVNELERFQSAPNPIALYHFSTRNRRMISTVPTMIYAGIFDVSTPYIDANLCDFLLSLDPDDISPIGFHDDTIATAFPEYSDIRYQKKHTIKKNLIGPISRAKQISHFAKDLITIPDNPARNLLTLKQLLKDGLRLNFPGNTWVVSRSLFLSSAHEVLSAKLPA